MYRTRHSLALRANNAAPESGQVESFDDQTSNALRARMDEILANQPTASIRQYEGESAEFCAIARELQTRRIRAEG